MQRAPSWPLPSRSPASGKGPRPWRKRTWRSLRRPAATPRQGTRRDDGALNCARRSLSRRRSGGESGVSPRPSRTGRRVQRQGSGARRVGRGHLDAGRADGDRRNFLAAAGGLSFLLPPDSAAGDGGAGDRHHARAHRQRPRAPSHLALGDGALLSVTGAAVTLLAQPVSEWIAKAPEIGATIKQKLYVLDRPLAALRELQEVLLPSTGNAVAVEPSQLGIVTPVVAFVTPAVV